MSNFNAARKPLKMHEDRMISRAPLRLLESPWQRTPLRCIDETFAGAAGNLAARGLGAVFNTRGHRLRAAASERQYRDQMRQHYSDSPGASAHLNKEFEKSAADQSQKATHGRFSRFFSGDPSKRGGEHGEAPSTTTSHTPPTVTSTHAASSAAPSSAPAVSTNHPAVASNGTVTSRSITPMGNPAHPQGAANRAALLTGKPAPKSATAPAQDPEKQVNRTRFFAGKMKQGKTTLERPRRNATDPELPDATVTPKPAAPTKQVAKAASRVADLRKAMKPAPKSAPLKVEPKPYMSNIADRLKRSREKNSKPDTSLPALPGKQGS